MGAGAGYWAKLLKVRHAVDCLLYDLDATDDTQSVSGNGTKLHHVRHHVMAQGDASSVKHHKDRALFLCWPPKDDPMAYDSLMNYAGDKVIYVGEWEPVRAPGLDRALRSITCQLDVRGACTDVDSRFFDVTADNP